MKRSFDPSSSLDAPFLSTLTRAHVGDDKRYTINDGRYPIDDKGIDDSPYADKRYGINDTRARICSEADLKRQFGVAFLRTPRDEALIVDNASYLGKFHLYFQLRPGSYDAHFWIVDFHRVEGRDLERPIRGLLQIKASTWNNSGLGEPRFAVQGRCKIIDSRTETLRIERITKEAVS